jgi:hypothetical protein
MLKICDLLTDLDGWSKTGHCPLCLCLSRTAAPKGVQSEPEVNKLLLLSA